MINNKKLFLDQDCPLCQAYASCFVHYGLMDPSVVDSYQKMDPTSQKKINLERAKSEIALFDVNTHNTRYGIDAILHIIGNRFPLFEKIMRYPMIYPIPRSIYSFISHNRKVIIPAKPAANELDCTPALHHGYRWIYIVSVALITGLILGQFTYWIFPNAYNWWREYLICFGQVAWQGVFIHFINKSRRMEYLGNMSTVSLIGGILLLPMFLIQSFYSVHPIALIFYFFLAVSFMLWEHIRRCKLLGLPLTMSGSWVLYRVFVLVIILSIEL